MSDWGWVGSVAVPLVVAVIAGVFGGGLVTLQVQRGDANRRLRRDGYAEAVAALYSWYEYPYEVRRRTSDDPETLDRLVRLGHQNQQRIARSLAWVAGDNQGAFTHYRDTVDSVKDGVGDWTRDAWDSAPIQAASEMNLGGWGPESIDDEVEALLEALAERMR